MSATAPASATAIPASAKTEKPRLMSLDVFRGLTIAAMMTVNNAGDWSNVYPTLKHTEWHGWTFTDTVFPFFVWIVGVAIPFALVRRLEEGQAKGPLLAKILRRSITLYAIGVFLNGFPFYDFIKHQGLDWSMYRIPGVLQRIAICYLVSSIIVLNTKIRGQIIAAAAFLIGYIVLMRCGSMPGFPVGDLSKEGNFSHYVDTLVWGKHVYEKAKTWDPEGFLSTLPAIGSCLLGVLIGQLLRSKRSEAEKASWIFTSGALLMFGGQLLNFWMPINKPIWTSSYALFMAGLAATVFGVCYWLVDVQRYQKWCKPFAIYGMNAIAVYIAAGILGRLTIKFAAGDGITPLKTFFYDSSFGKLATSGVLRPENASLCWAVSYALLMYLIAYVLYRKKWFLRI